MRYFVAAIFVALASFAAPVFAQEMPTLTIGSPAGSLTLDRGELEALGMVSIKTSTPWTQGVVDFQGVPLQRLLDKAGAKGTTVTVTALNDYSVDIPVSDFAAFGPILAIKRDGQYMPVDDKGPFFIIYPFDSDPKLQGQTYFGRAVWQVKAMTVQ